MLSSLFCHYFSLPNSLGGATCGTQGKHMMLGFGKTRIETPFSQLLVSSLKNWEINLHVFLLPGNHACIFIYINITASGFYETQDAESWKLKLTKYSWTPSMHWYNTVLSEQRTKVFNERYPPHKLHEGNLFNTYIYLKCQYWYEAYVSCVSWDEVDLHIKTNVLNKPLCF